MRPGLIIAQVMLELALLIGVGVLVGIGLMVLTLLPFGDGLNLGFLAAGSEMAGGGSVLYPKIDLADTLTYSLVVWVLGVATTIWPARTAARIQPVVAMGAA